VTEVPNELTPEAVLIELNSLKSPVRHTVDPYRRDRAIEKAMAAVRKQIPKKADKFSQFSFVGAIYYCCDCGMEVSHGDNFCLTCGQAFDWRSE
jgi:hypothetical protein